MPIRHPEWTKNATIYEINIRQLTPEGTFNAALPHLHRIKSLGFDIVWIMPIFPIGELDRKGSLGSYYSIKDYTTVNPEFGTLKDFKKLVAEAHRIGLRVIIDWVANHTSRDAVWIAQHPEWYLWDTNGGAIAPYDWTDVAQLDTHNRQMWEEMARCMIYWIKEAEIDGFRCDMASLLPIDFWEFIRQELDKVQHVFMLAESEDYLLHRKAFNATYCWELHHIMNGIAQGKNEVADLDRYFKKQHLLFTSNDMRLAFTSNHDENSWSGTEFERMGLAAKTMAVFTFILPSLPLVYNGQEVALSRRLPFFDKDCITWNVNLDFEALYKGLVELKKRYQSLWNAGWGGSFDYSIDSMHSTFTVRREKNNESITAIFNFSTNSTRATTPSFATSDYFKGTLYGPNKKVSLMPWEYLVLINID